MKRTLTRLVLPVVLTPLLTLAVAGSASAEPPRPGCGYGDAQHAHQAAPGRDPLGPRPGAGTGDTQDPGHPLG